MESVLHGKFMVLSVCIKNWRDLILITHFKALEKQEVTTPKRSRHEEIIKVRAKVNEIERTANN